MPSAPLHTFAFLSQIASQDSEDKVISATRIVDIFLVGNWPGVPLEAQVLPLNVVMGAVFPAGDAQQHSFSLRLLRPNGESTPVGLIVSELSKINFPAAPVAIHAIARFGVLPKVMGVHFVEIDLDGKSMATVPFTLERIPSGS